MKKLILFVIVLLPACSTVTKVSVNDNNVILTQYTEPIKIFGIGRYKANSYILTLVDSKNQYFTLEAPADTSLKIGSTYH